MIGTITRLMLHLHTVKTPFAILQATRAVLTATYCTSATMAETPPLHVEYSEVKRFIVDCMKKVGTIHRHAESLANNLTCADYRGHYSHGLNRLDMYMKDIAESLTCCEDIDPVVVKETVATAYVDGNNLLGPVVGEFCMNIAIDKAKTAGIGFVNTRNSNHFGICAYYSMMATQTGLIGMSFTNTSPVTVPTRAKQATLGTNPLSLSAPGNHGDTFDLDMATSAVALGKVEIAQRREEDIPIGWAVDKDGQNTSNPSAMLEDGGLLPLGSLENTSSYKGYGLAMAVEVLTSILAGAKVGPNVRQWKTRGIKADLGQTFIAIDPTVFADGFSDRMSDLMDHCRNLQPVAGEKEVLVAGDPERHHMTLCDQSAGIPYHRNQITYANDIAVEYGVTPIALSQKV